jgi:hypothetical protein
VPGAAVTAHRFDKNDDGSTNRRRIFLTYNDAGNAAGLPASVFCKAAETLENRIVSGTSGAGINEVEFYSKVRSRLDIAAPKALYASYDYSNDAFLLMMEDFGDTVKFCDQNTPVDEDRARSQLRTLAKLHSAFYQSPELGAEALPFRGWDVWWREMMDQTPEFGVYCDIAFGETKDIIPPRLYARREEIWPATMESARRHAELPHCLIHCDVHLKNWYMAPGGVMGIGDYQCLSTGHWSRDLAYTITTALDIEDRRRLEKDLVRFYLDEMETNGVPRISEDEAWFNMRQQLMSVLAFWTITLRPSPGMPDMQPEQVSLKFLERIYAAMDDHQILDAF